MTSYMEHDNGSFQQFKDLYLQETHEPVNAGNFDTFLQFVQAHQSIIIAQRLCQLSRSISSISDRLDNIIDTKKL